MPNDMALKYYNEGIDEIIFMDAVASYYDRNSLSKIIDISPNNIFEYSPRGNLCPFSNNIAYIFALISLSVLRVYDP